MRTIALSYEQVNAILECDFESGRLIWKDRPANMFTEDRFCKIWNGRYAGTEAFRPIDRNGYHVGAIFNRQYRAHRVVWLLAHKVWPSNQIDHINGVRTDNRLSNLRDVEHRENGLNQRLSKRNKSGVTGVCWHKRSKKWLASIRVNGSNINLGEFKDFSTAVDRRRIAEEKFGFHPNHGRNV